MKANWYGNGCFLLKGTKISILIDPAVENIGDLIQKEDIDVVLKTEACDYAHELVFDWPGEYETKGLGVVGFSFKTAQEKEIVSFVLSHGRIKICHLGKLDRELTDEEIASLGDIDVLFLPIGGKDVMNAKTAHKVLEAIDPRMVIPMYYSSDGEDNGYAPLDDFKREMGIKDYIEAKENIEFKNLSEDQTDIVILSKK